MYAYRALLETLLNYGKEAKTTWLQNEMFYKDTSEGIDQTNPDAKPVNNGLFIRYNLTKNSKLVDLIARPHADLFHQNRSIIPNIDIRVKIMRSPAEFALMAPAGDPNAYMVKIHSASLLVRSLEVSAEISSRHQEALQNGQTCKYPLHRCDVNTYSIPRGVMSHSRSAAITGQLPVRIILGLVRNDAINGTYSLNPYDFSGHGLSFISLIVNGRTLTAKPITPQLTDPEDGLLYARAYETLFSGIDKQFQDAGSGIDISDYKKGYTLFAFKLSEDFGEEYFGLKKEGNLQIDLRFQKPIDHTLNVVLYHEYLNILEIDQNKMVSFDYSA
jgi:hypothetical protein